MPRIHWQASLRPAFYLLSSLVTPNVFHASWRLPLRQPEPFQAGRAFPRLVIAGQPGSPLRAPRVSVLWARVACQLSERVTWPDRVLQQKQRLVRIWCLSPALSPAPKPVQHCGSVTMSPGIAVAALSPVGRTPSCPPMVRAVIPATHPPAPVAARRGVTDWPMALVLQD